MSSLPWVLFLCCCDPQEQMRVMSEAKQLAGATFRPDLSPSRQWEGECFAVSVRGGLYLLVAPC